MSQITLGLSEIQVGEASKAGVMPTEMTKIGKTYADTCKISQEVSEVTEHYEEGMAAPEVRGKQKKVPVVVFSIMDADLQMLADYVGGEVTGSGATEKWVFNGTEEVANKAISIIPKMGYKYNIPNADIEAVMNADMSQKGISLIDFTVTPMAVSAGGAIQAEKLVKE